MSEETAYDRAYELLFSNVGKNRKNVVPLLHAEDGMKNSGEWDSSAGKNVDFSKTTFMSYDSVITTWSWQMDIRDDSFDNGGYTYIDENGLYRSAKTLGVKADDDYYIVAMGNGFPISAAQHQANVDLNNKNAGTTHGYIQVHGDGTYNFVSANPDNDYTPMVSGNCLLSKRGNEGYTDGMAAAGQFAGYTCQVTLQDETGKTYTFDVLVGDTKGDSNSLLPHDHPMEFIVDGKPNSNINSGGNVDYTKLLGAKGTTYITDISIYEDGARYVYSEWGQFCSRI